MTEIWKFSQKFSDLQLATVFGELMSLTVTYEREGRGQREKHAVTVHGERDGEVHGQTAQHEESIHRRPVRHLEPQLRTQRKHVTLLF